MRFSETLIEELRAVSVATVIGRDHKLIKSSAHEFRLADDNSFTINTQKNIWHDFGAQKGGDVFAYLMFARGLDFEHAVEEVASIAGIPLPAPKANGKHAPSHADGPPPGHPAAEAAAPAREMVATYPYFDADNNLLYEVVRLEWLEDGRRRKITPPRRPVPGEPERWIWGLKAGEFVQARNGDWYSADGARSKWSGERRHFDAVEPVLYRLPELLDELVEEPDDQRTVLLPEGEKDCDTLRKFNLLAVTSMGGTSGWLPHYAERFRDADVVVLMDNDEPGRKLGHLKAASLNGIARRVRVLDWRDHWPGCPEGGDVSDWFERGGGSDAKLLNIIGELRTWVPTPPVSSFGAVRFVDLDVKAQELEWLVRGIITRGEVSIWYGPTQSGKSFLLTDLAFSIALGRTTWMGCKLARGLVIYQAGESGSGFRKRMRAYRHARKLDPNDDVPFVALTRQVDLYKDDADVDKLIAEINGWRAYYDEPLELVVLDTFNVASVGADENSSKDVGQVLRRVRRVSIECSCHVAIVHHMNAKGDRPRGHTSLLSNADNAVLVEPLDHKDANGRDLRQFKVTKQRDGAVDLERTFVLHGVDTGRVDAEGEAETSCVVEESGTRVAKLKKDWPKDWARISEDAVWAMRALERALVTKGALASTLGAKAPVGVRAVAISEWQTALLEQQVGHQEITPKLKERLRKQIYRACQRWNADGINIIGVGGGFVWRTSRRVAGLDHWEPPAPKAEPSLPQDATMDFDGPL